MTSSGRSFARRFAAQQQQPVARRIQFVQRHLQQPAGDARTVAQQCFKGLAAKTAQSRSLVAVTV